MQVRYRDRAIGGDPVYLQWKLYANGAYCYPQTSVGVEAARGKASVSGSSANVCGSGWHHEKTWREENINKGGHWELQKLGAPIMLDQNSVRLAMRPCQDENWSPDTCLEYGGRAAYRSGGVSY